jgi:dinuclear metal center YbgI/SA1388 family protein
MPTIAEIADYLNDFAPMRTATEWDNVGLILGERAAPVAKILTCLTVTPEVVAEAVRDGVNLIVTHHPMLFRAVQKITDATPQGRMVLALARAKIAVYSPHTAFDNCAGGINEMLAHKLGLTQVKALRPAEAAKQCKLVVFVPDQDLAKVSDAMFAAGAGRIGQYRECSFRVAGTGTFFGEEASHPAVGQKGRREDVAESRLEVVCPESAVDAVVAAMRLAHSYEEPAFDVYSLRPARSSLGDGRFGMINPMELREFAGRVRAVLGCGPVQLVGNPQRAVGAVALACGAAGEFLKDAVRVRADVFLTGELRFHDFLEAQQSGIGLVLPGHYATERFGVEALAERLGSKWPELAVQASTAECDPVQWV